MSSTGSRLLRRHSVLRRHGFTLLEFLITITVISLLLALLLPAIQSARESGRRAQCQNNLKQIALALLVYHDSNGTFPCGGWGHEWVGVPERGVGREQPGGWIYCLLPHLDNASLHDLGSDATGDAATELYSRRLQTPVVVFTCSTRRVCVPWPIADLYSYVRSPKPFGNVMMVARADYAINGGASNIFSFSGPADFKQGNDKAFWSNAPHPIKFNGVSHLRIGASIRSITDGTSKTYLVGEKFLDAASYATGTSTGDNESLYAGYCTDLHRFTGMIEGTKLSLSPFATPLNDYSPPNSIVLSAVRFGSAHAPGLNMANCDGSVHLCAFDIDAEVHLRNGHRNDQEATLQSIN